MLPACARLAQDGSGDRGDWGGSPGDPPLLLGRMVSAKIHTAGPSRRPRRIPRATLARFSSMKAPTKAPNHRGVGRQAKFATLEKTTRSPKLSASGLLHAVLGSSTCTSPRFFTSPRPSALRQRLASQFFPCGHPVSANSFGGVSFGGWLMGRVFLKQLRSSWTSRNRLIPQPPRRASHYRFRPSMDVPEARLVVSSTADAAGARTGGAIAELLASHQTAPVQLLPLRINKPILPLHHPALLPERTPRAG
jgi:hypothetical protein